MNKIIISVAIGYLFGSFLTAEAVSYKCTGKSIKYIGTGNPGMANVMSQIGKKQGVIVLVGDILKILVAFFLSWQITGQTSTDQMILFTGFGGILGHNYPLWRKLHGGKGVTVTCTWLIVLMPLWGTISCIAGGIITLLTGYLPLGAVLIPFIAIPFTFWQKGIIAGCIMTAASFIMFTKHYHGLKRIIQGKENKINLINFSHQHRHTTK
ncbi:MAG: glycerol-3-phosphate acyltransferase [Clostridia bacterium]|nr:glycerol-3-phosphate acyltransferase [Clostridia bacterium]